MAVAAEEQPMRRVQVIGFFITGTDQDGRARLESDVQVRLGRDVRQQTARVIAENNAKNNYIYVCTLDETGRLLYRAARAEAAEQKPVFDLRDGITVVAFSLASNDAVIFHAEGDDLDARQVTLDFVRHNQDTDLQYVCTLGGNCRILYTAENLMAG